MNRLIAVSNIAFANTFCLYFKTASYHWNVESSDFQQYHDFFGDMYAEIYGSVDDFAEFIRTLDAYAPISLMEINKYKSIAEDIIKPNLVEEMLNNLYRDNEIIIDSLNATFKEAIDSNEQGFANFIADRLAAHKKHAWKLRSMVK